MECMKVISPAGVETIEHKGVAPRLDGLAGKTVGEIWNGVFKGDDTFPVVRDMLKRAFPGINVIPYTEFPFFPGDDRPASQQAMAKEIAVLAKAKGCDAVISGNGA